MSALPIDSDCKSHFSLPKAALSSLQANQVLSFKGLGTLHGCQGLSPFDDYTKESEEREVDSHYSAEELFSSWSPSSSEGYVSLADVLKDIQSESMPSGSLILDVQSSPQTFILNTNQPTALGKFH